jgi:Flp pilus assembly protein TadD
VTANALFRLGRDQEASDLIDGYLEEDPNDEGGVVTSVRALMLARSGKRAEAEETIARAIRLGQGVGHFHTIPPTTPAPSTRC